MSEASEIIAPAVQPAEWAEHRACVTAWPASVEAWGPPLADAQREFATFVRAFCDHADETLLLLTPGGERPAELSEVDGHLRCLAIPYGDVWLRDIAPVYLSDGSAVAFAFNGWGGKYRYPHDTEVAAGVATALGTPLRRVPMVAEGGALESDGAGTYLTTRACLLNDNRNPNLQEADIDGLLARCMGARRVIWLDEGLRGDHTDGHIDNIARFVAAGTVVCTESPADDPNHAVHTRVEAALREAIDAEGRRLTVHPLPSPGPVLDDEGAPMPASYMNFYIANGAVFVPAYDVPADGEACERLAKLFPTRRVIPIPSRAILTGGGSLHCVTQQVIGPDGDAAMPQTGSEERRP